MTVYFMSPLDWSMGCQIVGLTVLGVSETVFSPRINIRIGRVKQITLHMWVGLIQPVEGLNWTKSPTLPWVWDNSAIGSTHTLCATSDPHLTAFQLQQSTRGLQPTSPLCRSDLPASIIVWANIVFYYTIYFILHFYIIIYYILTYSINIYIFVIYYMYLHTWYIYVSVYIYMHIYIYLLLVLFGEP